MEEYETKRQYLRHLKRMGQIRDGSSKLPLCTHPHPFNSTLLSRTKSRELLTTTRNCLLSTSHTSTERIMREFTVEKENTRLVTKILKMGSSIPLRKYEQDYEDSKRFLLRPQKGALMTFKFFDIHFTQSPTSPQDYFELSLQLPGKRVLLAKDTLFQLRKRDLRFKRGGEVVIRVEGQGQWGVVRIKGEESLVDIRHHGEKIGHVVIEHVSK